MKKYSARQKARLLVVEDETATGRMCVQVLSREGFKVELACNGRIGMEKMSQHDFDLCLLDIRLPVISGLVLYEWLLENRSRLAKRIIFTTGDTMSKDLLLYIEKTGRPFLPKPFTPNELLYMVKKNLPGF